MGIVLLLNPCTLLAFRSTFSHAIRLLAFPCCAEIVLVPRCLMGQAWETQLCGLMKDPLNCAKSLIDEEIEETYYSHVACISLARFFFT